MKYILYPLTRGKSVGVMLIIGVGLILLGRWVSPVDALDMQALDEMSTGKWVTFSGYAALIVASLLGFVGLFVKKPRNARTENRR